MDVMVWFACRRWVRGPVVTCLLWVSGKSFASGFFSKARRLAGVLWASRVGSDETNQSDATNEARARGKSGGI
ncbi:hypothetical protein M408DRAFT_328963 [Serendipita vermifera MAFF 305830]|uniref:Uncharacterized protein n=1 Tax=Serendipita vermifera MAFF 305830 TaxID=933852 RepID=A0A0C3AXQ8_SERVB|nr:hypothetical protein M408DRAFT_328963 [Serendipita vermifera MAFF 305830]